MSGLSENTAKRKLVNPKTLYDAGRKLPLAPFAITLEDNTKLTNITPYSFMVSSTNILVFRYIDLYHQKHRLNADKIIGWNTVTTPKNFGTQPAISFMYYKTDQNRSFYEPTPRVVIPKDIVFGLHPQQSKLGEKPDFYMVCDDTRYPPGDATRHFPFWRMKDIYGQPEHFSNIMLGNYNP